MILADVFARWRLRRIARQRLRAMAAQDRERRSGVRVVRFITPAEAHHAVISRVLRTGLPHTATREPSGLYRVEEVGDG